MSGKIELFIHYNLLPMTDEAQDEYTPIIDGALLVKDATIIWVGGARDIPESPKPDVIHDGKGLWLLPGLIDCHTHLVFAGSRSNEFARLRQGESYADIAASGGGIIQTMRQTSAAPYEDLLETANHRLKQWSSDGVTSIEIKSGYGLTLDDELKMLRVIASLQQTVDIDIFPTFLAAHKCPPEFLSHDAHIDFLITEGLDTVASLDINWHGQPTIDAYCDPIGYTPHHIDRLFNAYTKAGFQCRLHTEQTAHSGGTEVAIRHQAISVDHLEHINDTQILQLAASQTSATLLPLPYLHTREAQCPPVEKMRAHRVPMAVATDFNPGSSPIASLPLAAYCSTNLFGLSTTEALLGITRQAARVLNKTDRGQLTVGTKADFSIWDMSQPDDLVSGLGLARLVQRVYNKA